MSERLTQYEKGYLAGMLAYAYRCKGDPEVYVGRAKYTTYRQAVSRFLHSRGKPGWSARIKTQAEAAVGVPVAREATPEETQDG